MRIEKVLHITIIVEVGHFFFLEIMFYKIPKEIGQATTVRQVHAILKFFI